MGQPVYLQPCYVLHSRNYRETSVLITLFSRDYGRVDGICRSVRRLTSPFKGLLQPFAGLRVSWAGRGDLVTLKDVEMIAMPVAFPQQRLAIGLYCNELLMRLLPRRDAHEVLFDGYAELIHTLGVTQTVEPVLRSFEMMLLGALGYGINFALDAQGSAVKAEQAYRYQPEQGFFPVLSPPCSVQSVFIGKQLTAIAQQRFDERSVCQDAKRLLRLALMHRLDYKPIRSRELFIKEMSHAASTP